MDSLRVNVDAVTEVGREHTIASAKRLQRVHANAQIGFFEELLPESSNWRVTKVLVWRVVRVVQSSIHDHRIHKEAAALLCQQRIEVHLKPGPDNALEPIAVVVDPE